MTKLSIKSLMAAGSTLAMLAGAFVLLLRPAPAQISGNGIISGTVKIDHGSVRGFRVKAKDTVRRITYMVYTNKGAYRIYNLPAGHYEVSAMEEGVASPTQRVELAAGQTATADLSVKATNEVLESVGVAGSRAQENYGASKVTQASNVKLVSFDTLYPPGKARDLLNYYCFGCHGPAGWHERGTHTEAQWSALVNGMFDDRRRLLGMRYSMLAPGTISDEEKQIIVKYLAENFGPNAELRDLQPDPVVRDEEALARTVFVQYELPPVSDATLKILPRARRGIHDVFPSPTMPGVIWLAGVNTSSVLKFDTRNPDPEKRVKEWLVEDERKINVGVHGVVETHGHVYWTELVGDHIGELDIKTEEIRRYPSVTPAGAHTPRADSKGNIWFSDVSAGGKIGRWDAETKKMSEFEPVKGANYYGVVVDKKDRVFVAGTTKKTLVMWDPKAKEWSNLNVPDNVRRVALDSKDNVWACAYMGNSVIRVDANTLKVEEYKLPLKNGNPYAVYVDKEDNVWLENAVYNSFVKFDPKNKKFTYFPFPELSSHTPNMEMDSEGTVWFGMGSPSQLMALKLNGNVPSSKTASR